MLDRLPATFYQSSFGSSEPSLTLYFGAEMTVSLVTVVNGLQKEYLEYLEKSEVSVMVSGGYEPYSCGIITNVNTESLEEMDQTYIILCNNTVGIGVKLTRLLTAKAKAWCIAEIVIQYYLPGKL